MLSEARDCPICFEPFTVQDQVVQLKCNRYHVFHYNCMERYMRYYDENEPLAQPKQCPLCREEVQIEEQPAMKV